MSSSLSYGILLLLMCSIQRIATKNDYPFSNTVNYEEKKQDGFPTYKV